MCLNLHDYQSKASTYSYGLTYLKARVTTNQNQIIGSQKSKIKELKHIQKKNYQTKKKKKRRKEQRRITKSNGDKCTYLSIITLNVNELNIPIKRQSGRLHKRIRTYNMLPTKDSF